MRELRVQATWFGLVAFAGIGAVTGLVAVGFEEAVKHSLEELFEAASWVIALSLIGGAVAASLLTHFFGGQSSATTDVYIEQFHDDPPPVKPKHALGRLAGGLASLSSGAPLGLEGPAVYAGTVVARAVQARWRAANVHGHQALMIAGAAAGVAAVFKAPAAGAIFALEVPFRGRLAGDRVLPAIIGSASGYLTQAAIEGTAPLVPLSGIDLSVERAALALLLGLIIGIVARGVIRAVTIGEHLSTRGSPLLRGLVAGGALAGFFALGRVMTGENVAIGSGKETLEWALDPGLGAGVLIGVLLLRTLGTSAAIGGGGVGGLFIPLLAMGAVVGRLFADVGNLEEVTLFVLVGGAAMLGTGYAAPLTGVVFVAEITAQPALIVPALIGMATAMLTVGNRSVSPAQL
jgi:CIC family chloride channel protein